MELDPQIREYEHPYQQPIAMDANKSQAYIDLNPQTRDDSAAYQELDNISKIPQAEEIKAYEEIKEAKPKQQVYQEIADNKEESQAYLNVKPKKHGQAKRK